MRPIFLLIFGLHVLAPMARAESSEAMKLPEMPNALEHYRKGNKLYNLRNFEGAIAEYKAGAMIEPTPVFDYNLGQAYRLTGHYVEAIWHFERLLRVEQNSERRVLVTALLSQMRAELDRRAMTTADPPPTPIATTPAPIAITPPSDVARHRWYEDTVGWGLFGSGALTLGVSGVLLVGASELVSQANAEPNQRSQEDLRHRADQRQLAATIIGVGGAALTITGVLKLIVNNKPPKASFGISTTGLILFARF